MTRMKGSITYRFTTPYYPGCILYVNMIGRYACQNNCRFCARPRTKEEIGKPNIYEAKAASFLYLPKAPSVGRIIKSIQKDIRKDDCEIAIIGLGEPLLYLPKAVELIARIKSEYPHIKVRVDTNGLAKCLFEKPAEKLARAGLDEIRISLNAINEREYDELCRPGVKAAFPNLISFIKDCIREGIDTRVSFIVGFEKSGRNDQELVDFAVSLGVKPEKVLLRQYQPPIQ